jgi:hypothetical protein
VPVKPIKQEEGKMSSAVNVLEGCTGKEEHHRKSERQACVRSVHRRLRYVWPRSHHIGKAPLKKAIMEGHIGGRCYSEQTDGTECDWGRITTLGTAGAFCDGTAQWEYQPDVMKSSEVDVRFTPESDGTTRVDLEHRHFERIGAGWESMREMVDSKGGWGGTLQPFAAQAEKQE